MYSCFQRYGSTKIAKLQLAVQSCEIVDVMDERLLHVVSSSVGLGAEELRNMYIDVSGRAPNLLRGSVSGAKVKEIFLFPPTKHCLNGCLYERGDQKGYPLELSYHNDPAEAGTITQPQRLFSRMRLKMKYAEPHSKASVFLTTLILTPFCQLSKMLANVVENVNLVNYPDICSNEL
ncbi:uncharacterized protein LOC129582401 [Paramacrobiotus metropolitanus]|uniref:uncharacterized protein LOC129582401 n=1 Tax=Paramacrobiotus metropolitanus TaxID=2943436 RepID=UPI002446122B|nr:uncharacterized protein LOC129582401 [Paramacrobiotus metropolitanus]